MINTREHILNVSLKLFLQKNFKEVTMKEIVEKTGLSKGAFYHYFESKEQLFLEVLSNTLASVTNVFENLNKDSLYQFYHSYFDYYQNMLAYFQVDKNDNEVGSFDLNIFTLYFDGIKLFPSFQDKIYESLQFELNAWKEVVCSARENGEINSIMTDEQIAKMFIYSSDGIGMSSIIMKMNTEHTKSKMLELWDSFYQEIKS